MADSVLTSEEKEALKVASKEFNKRSYSLYNHRIRPKNVSIFDWLSSKPNTKAFKDSQKIMKELR